MSAGFDASDDFGVAVDGLEDVTLVRRATSATLQLATAWRGKVRRTEAEPSQGAVEQSDAVWYLQLPAGEIAPELGDAIIDSNNRRWTVLEMSTLVQLGRWRCIARDLAVAHSCMSRVDVERAVWDDLGSGPEIVDWVYVVTAMPVRIQHEEISTDEFADPPISSEVFRIVLSETIKLEPNDRFVTEDGVVYRLLSYRQAERIDALPVAIVRREAAA